MARGRGSGFGLLGRIIIVVVLGSLFLAAIKELDAPFSSTLDDLGEIFGRAAQDGLNSLVNGSNDATVNRQTPIQDSDANILTVTFIDVGQGDCILLELGGHAMIIDGGYPEYSDKIYAILESKGLEHLDAIVATHYHADHIGGLGGAIEYASIDHFYVPYLETENPTSKIVLDKAARRGLKSEVLAAGDTFTMGEVNVAVLGPLSASEDENNNSLVLKATYGSVSFLLTGDCAWDEEQEILESGADLKADVLKVGHHGSSGSSGYHWLYEIDPSIAIIQVAENNEYFQPHEKALSRLRDAGVKLYRTDLQGTVVVQTDGEIISVTVEKNEDIDTFSNWGAAE